MRIAIIGGPKTGKTTLAKKIGGARSTDELIHLGWSGASQEASKWFDEPGPWMIEGVALPRALRKWRERNPFQKPPVDKIIYLRKPHQPLLPGQMSMSKGVDTVMKELMPWLRTHGVEITNGEEETDK